jgi:hypothetical protein
MQMQVSKLKSTAYSHVTATASSITRCQKIDKMVLWYAMASIHAMDGAR